MYKERQAIERCRKCEHCKLDKAIFSTKGLEKVLYRCFAKSEKGRIIQGELLIKCPLGRK